MTPNEIINALWICNNPKGHRCSECPVFSRYEHRVCKATVDKAAAILIESLKAENEILQEEIEKYENRLEISPYGDDKIDELEEAYNQQKFHYENLKSDNALLRKRMGGVVDDMKYYLEANKEKGVAHIPPHIIEKNNQK
jgi:hypothetical protein